MFAATIAARMAWLAPELLSLAKSILNPHYVRLGARREEELRCYALSCVPPQAGDGRYSADPNGERATHQKIPRRERSPLAGSKARCFATSLEARRSAMTGLATGTCRLRKGGSSLKRCYARCAGARGKTRTRRSGAYSAAGATSWSSTTRRTTFTARSARRKARTPDTSSGAGS